MTQTLTYDEAWDDDEVWRNVEATVAEADSIAWDGCHKVYVLMDMNQTAEMRSYGYGRDGSHLRLTSECDALAKLRLWFDDSCELRFINAVRSVTTNPNDGFTTLIPQGYHPDPEPEEDDE